MGTTRRRPINIEFTGTPEAGKTTQKTIISKWLQNNGYKVTTIQESAELIPAWLEKGSVEANRWMRIKCIGDLISANASDVDVVIVDRGIVDGLIWSKIYYTENKISFEEMKFYELWINEVKLEPDLLLAFFLDPETSIQRRGGEGRIVTRHFIGCYNFQVKKFLDSYHGNFLKVDASRTREDVTRELQETICRILP